MDDQTLEDWNTRLVSDANEEATIFKEMVDLGQRLKSKNVHQAESGPENLRGCNLR